MIQHLPITGLGCICAAGPDVQSSLTSMLRGERHPAPALRFATDHRPQLPVFEVPQNYLTDDLPPEADCLRTSQLAMVAAAEALRGCGRTMVELQTLRVGVCIGTTVGSAMNNEEFYRQFRQGEEPEMGPINRYLRSNPAATVAAHFQLKGPVATLVNACSSGTDAIGLAASWLRAGLCDLALAGGADELCRTTFNGFASLQIAAAEPVRPFAAERKGLNLGEGAGMLLLGHPDIVREGERVQGWLRGYGSATDAYHLTAPHPEGAGLRRAIAEALEQAACRPEDIAFINAHGTGTPDNDRVESRVLAELFAGIPFVSSKGYTGHTLGAAGGIEAVITLASLNAGEVPASIGCEPPDAELPALPERRTFPVTGGLAISESLAFGGNNSLVILEGGGAS
ncbi:beta-ketoacyl-[acyl-carrier-protein] synthase family protein [Geothermobacter hydrogeniphilus]|uniref:Beta-ketoacyl-[acyl-carrier-protein] synthase family protein n=1 Tax=Geothermobacter hydrogeniphilus TaxID=1969733 RepID=A0A2K2HBM3_9BACT|nr:beta-ketoacyl-[acyl-carrier-protein] synthase family protein [Geothermobacter hydrogeniphilus]PNU20629.1 beta-ketoacyl-[acyl-carrier-protein] synthase family protein [Geothermobacter hydrogeniphilus]